MMTNEEAIELLHPNTTKEAIRRIEENGGDAIKAIEEACIVACEALEKETYFPEEQFECPVCGCRILGLYRLNCGQKFDWGEDE